MTDRLRSLQVRVWVDSGRAAAAVPLAREVVAYRRREYAGRGALLGNSLLDLGRGLQATGHPAEAESCLAECLAVYAAAPPPITCFPAWAECWLGAGIAAQNRPADAEPRLLAAERSLRDGIAPDRYRRHAVEQLVALYTAWGKSADAAAWRPRLAALPPAGP